MAKSKNNLKVTDRKTWPSEAATEIVQQRGSTYGHPGPIMEMFARLITAILHDKLKPGEVVDKDEAGHLMIALKQARDLHALDPLLVPDHLNDIAGYANVIYRVRTGE